MKGEELPVYGGYYRQGQLTRDPSAILTTRRTVPIGYWKGAGLSLLLDVVGAVLSGGLATHEISRQNVEKGLSQVFLAIDLRQLHNFRGIEAVLYHIIKDYKESVAEKEVRYPGEQVLRTRRQNREQGIPVLRKVWDEVLALQAEN